MFIKVREPRLLLWRCYTAIADNSLQAIGLRNSGRFGQIRALHECIVQLLIAVSFSSSARNRFAVDMTAVSLRRSTTSQTETMRLS